MNEVDRAKLDTSLDCRQPNWTSDRPFQALALSGGGYRGLFTARVLQTLEEHIGAPIGTRFDLLCGTSIGGILALAAAFEIPMERVVSMFERFGETVFNKRHPTSKWGKRWDTLRYWSRVRYSQDALRETLAEILPHGSTLADAKHAVAIPAVNVTQGRPQIFKTKHYGDWTRDANYSALEVALATAAAPTYFALAELDGHLYADGGLFANAPDLIAIHEPETFFSVNIKAIRLLSIGTTTRSYSLSFSEGRDQATSDWLQDGRLFDVTISAQQQFVDQIVRHRLGDRYLRIDHEPSPQQAQDLGLDRASPAARKTLMALGHKSATDLLGGKLKPYLEHRPQLNLATTH